MGNELSARNKISKFREILEERIDTDTLVDYLRERYMLKYSQVLEVKCRSTFEKKNEQIINYIIENRQAALFISALKGAKQQHLANYLTYNGDYSSEILKEWPLEKRHTQIIDATSGFFKDQIDFDGGLLDYLLAKGVISNRQKQRICSEKTDSEKAEVFLDHLRRGSIRDYDNTIQCLVDSNQPHVAEQLQKVLEKSGGVLPIHVRLHNTSEEVTLVEKITELLGNRSAVDADRIYSSVRKNLMGVKVGHSVVFYYYFGTNDLWQEAKNHYMDSGTLRSDMEAFCAYANPNGDAKVSDLEMKYADLKYLERHFGNYGCLAAIYYYYLEAVGIRLI